MQATAFSARSNRLAGLPEGGNGSMPWGAATCRTAETVRCRWAPRPAGRRKRFDAVGRRDLPDGGNGSMPWGAATCRLVFCASVSRIEACLVAQWVNWRCRMRFLLVFWCRCGFNVPSQGTLHAPLAVIVGLHRAAFLAAVGMRRDRVSSGRYRSRRRIDGTNR